MAWGLPQRYFQPVQLLEHAWQLLAPGGTMFIVNQGDQEAQAQQRLFDQVGLSANSLDAITSVFSPYKNKRIGWVLTRE